MKLICSIATIIERGKARYSEVLYYHTYLQSLALFVEQTQKRRYESGCDSSTSLVQSSDELAEHELTLRK